MIPFPQLNDQTFEQIVYDAVDKIQDYKNIWNDSDVHDPGVTILELLSYFKFTQQNHINVIGAKSLKKFLTLLGIKIKEASSAAVWCSLQSPEFISLPKGTKLLTGDIQDRGMNFAEDSLLIFETAECVNVINNSISSIVRNEIEIPNNIPTEIFGSIPEDGAEFLIRFEAPLPQNIDINMKMNIISARARNPVISNTFKPLSELEYFYYGEENGVIGFHKADVIMDSSYGFMFTGSVRFKINGQHKNNGKGYYIKCCLLKNGYEAPPKIQSLQLNNVLLKQEDTLCQAIHFDMESIKNNEMIFDSGITENYTSELFIKSDGKWYSYLSLKLSYHIDKNCGTRRLQIQDIDTLLKLLDNTEKGNLVRLVIKSHKMNFIDKMKGSDGLSNQSFKLETPGYIDYDKFQLMIGQFDSSGNMYFEDWHKVQDFDSSTPYELCYILDTKSSSIIFGDNEYGCAPPKAANNIYITGFAYTKGSEGNIRAGLITSLAEKDLDFVTVHQKENAAGGCDPESFDQAVMRARRDIDTVYRAITKKDYENIALRTEGLLLKSVTVLPLYKPKLNGYPEKTAPNCVTIVFDRYGEFENKYCTESYADRIKSNLEKYKLITTQIYVMSPQNIGLDIYGDIKIKAQYKNASELINEALINFIENIRSGQLGQPVYSGDVYGIIDRLDCTESIYYISLEATGDALQKSKLGDLIIPPYGRVYLRKNKLNVFTSNF